MVSEKKIGFFDVDSLQSGQAEVNAPEALFQGLCFQSRMYPLADALNNLYTIALNGNHPFVFCTCCSGRFLEPGERDDTLYIPVDEGNQSWRSAANDARMIYLQKVTTGNPKATYEQRCHMVFRHNANAMEYFKSSPINHWIIFGNGFDLCICSAVAGLLEAGKTVWLIDDVFVQSAKGYGDNGDSGTQEGRERCLKELAGDGVRLISLKDFKEWYTGSEKTADNECSPAHI